MRKRDNLVLKNDGERGTAVTVGGETAGSDLR